MPFLNVQTNIGKSTVEQAFLKEATSFVAEMLGKPEEVVMVKLESECDLFFGGEAEPAALAELKSIGLPEDQTQIYAEKLTNFISEKLNVRSVRVFVIFESYERHMWGWGGKTFAT